MDPYVERVPSYTLKIYDSGYLNYTLLCGTGYIRTSINDGPGCLNLRCPDPSCGAAVSHDMVNELASKDDEKKYIRFFLRSFIEDNRKVQEHRNIYKMISFQKKHSCLRSLKFLT